MWSNLNNLYTVLSSHVVIITIICYASSNKGPLINWRWWCVWHWSIPMEHKKPKHASKIFHLTFPTCSHTSADKPVFWVISGSPCESMIYSRPKVSSLWHLPYCDFMSSISFNRVNRHSSKVIYTLVFYLSWFKSWNSIYYDLIHITVSKIYVWLIRKNIMKCVCVCVC